MFTDEYANNYTRAVNFLRRERFLIVRSKQVLFSKLS
jgi:hypothetical protein